MAPLSYIDDRRSSTSSLSSSASTLQDTDWRESFTATGGPMPKHHTSTWAHACLWGPTAPHLPPFRFTDDSIIPVAVRVCADDESSKAGVESSKKQRSLRARFRRKDSKAKTVIAMMPRRDYLRYFAHDERGNYIGSEPEGRWSEEDLEVEFGVYREAKARRWTVRERQGSIYMEEE